MQLKTKGSVVTATLTKREIQTLTDAMAIAGHLARNLNCGIGDAAKAAARDLEALTVKLATEPKT